MQSLERLRYSGYSVGMQLTYASLRFLTHALRFARGDTHMGCTRGALPGEHGCGSRLHIVVMLRPLKFAYSCSPGFLGKRTTRVSTPYQTLPLCEGRRREIRILPQLSAMGKVAELSHHVSKRQTDLSTQDLLDCADIRVDHARVWPLRLLHVLATTCRHSTGLQKRETKTDTFCQSATSRFSEE